MRRRRRSASATGWPSARRFAILLRRVYVTGIRADPHERRACARPRWIYRHLDFTAEIGRCIAILGPNGRGKTTLVRNLLGFLALTEGSRSAPGIVGYVPQVSSAPVSYRVRTMVAMGRVAQRGLFAAPTRHDHQIADEVLERIGLTALAQQRFDFLSGGERQLVLLARALATGAATLVLDEPASALDLPIDRFLTVIESLRADGQHAIVSPHICPCMPAPSPITR